MVQTDWEASAGRSWGRSGHLIRKNTDENRADLLYS
jgi:hypothetical protein